MLTTQLQQLCGREVSIRFLQGSAAKEQGFRRRVLILCGAIPLVYAESLIPSATLCRFSWLRDLGNRPLGTSMAEQGELSRDRYEFARLESSCHLYQRAYLSMPAYVIERGGFTADSLPDLRARRFRLRLDSHPVDITEVFLPGVESVNREVNQSATSQP